MTVQSSRTCRCLKLLTVITSFKRGPTKSLGYIHTTAYYSAVKRSKLSVHAKNTGGSQDVKLSDKPQKGIYIMQSTLLEEHKVCSLQKVDERYYFLGFLYTIFSTSCESKIILKILFLLFLSIAEKNTVFHWDTVVCNDPHFCSYLLVLSQCLSLVCI